MKYFKVIIIILVVQLLENELHAELYWYECNQIEGAKIIAEDGTYLGTMGDSYNTDSIYNNYSSYGNESVSYTHLTLPTKRIV